MSSAAEEEGHEMTKGDDGDVKVSSVEEPLDIEKGSDHEHEEDVDDTKKYNSSSLSRWWMRMRTKSGQNIASYHMLVSDQAVLKRCLYILRFGIFADAMNSTILQPNYPIMVTPDADPDSFDSTDPFDFSTATYAIPMFALLGIAISATVSGRISDRVGRKMILLVSMYGSAIGSVVKWLLRNTFWGFCMASFANGLVSGSLPVALAYVGDVFRTRREKQEEFGMIVSFFVVGQSGGGVIAILMASTGLFAPLWVGAAMMFAAGTMMLVWLVEPGQVKVLSQEPDDEEDEEEEDGRIAPTEIDRCAFMNIVVGAFTDNVGSAGLFPICLSPLMFDRFYNDFIEDGEDPVLSLNGYKWLSVLVALVVIPTAVVTPALYEKIGVAAACVIGNIMTALVTLALLLIGTIPDATSGAMAGFIVVMYVGFPTTVFSQLSTSPMLDAISPVEKRGYVQGVNTTVMNVATAFAPWILGIIADGAGTSTAIWIGFGVSLLAAAVNAPLMFRPEFGPPPKKLPPSSRPLKGEDKEVVEKALRGSWVPQQVLTEINREREGKGEPYLVIHPRPYAEDKNNLDQLRLDAQTAFEYQKNQMDQHLISVAENQDEVPASCERANASLAVDPEVEAQIYKELGQWFADYIQDNGYFAYTNPVIMKQMIMKAFPTITKDKEFTPENLEEVLCNIRRIYCDYVGQPDERRYSRASVLGTGAARTLYG